MRHLIPLVPLLVMLVVPVMQTAPALAQPAPPAADLVADPWATSFRPMPFHRAAEIVSRRYAGRLVAAETRPPHTHERQIGVELVYQFRLLTPARTILNIRLDARDGRFLEVAGRGQLEARRAAPGP